MATGQVELVGTQIGSTGASGHDYTKLIDGDFSTYAEGTTGNGIYWGLDAGANVTVRTVKLAARLGDSGSATRIQYEDRTSGAKIQAADDSGFTSNLTDCYTQAATPPPTLPARHFTSVATTSPPSKRYWRYLGANGSFGDLCELRFIADAGVSSAKPVAPLITPAVGWNNPAGSQLVTLSSLTTSASLYYTLDGSTPTTGSTLYSMPFTVSGNVTLKVIASDASLATTLSDVSSAIFKNYGYAPNTDLFDDRGVLVEAHSGGLLKGAGGRPLLVNGFYWWYGGSANRYNVVLGFSDGLGIDGIWLYKSTDLYNWIFVGNILDNAASIYTVRPHVIFCAATSKYVLWAKTYTTTNAAIATADAPDGPWTWQNTAYTMGGVGYADATLFLDDDGTAYAIWEEQTLTTIYIQALASDFLTVTGSRTTIVTGGGHEAPAIAKDHTGTYVLIYSNPVYYDSVNGHFAPGVAWATTPLGTWAKATVDYGAYQTDPFGTANNAQPTDLLAFSNGMILVGDYYRQDDMYLSRMNWNPVDDYVGIPASWDRSWFARPANDLKTGLVAYYGCDEITGTSDLVDKVGGLTLTRTGTMNCYGARLRSRDFDSQQASHANHASFRVTGVSFFLSVWAFLNATGTYAFVASKWDATNLEYAPYVTPAGKLEWQLSANGTSSAITVTGTTTVPTTTFFMATFYYDITLNKAGIFYNTTLDAESTYSGGVASTTADFWLGREGNVSNRWPGRMRMFGLWKTSKPTTTQIAALYNGGRGLPYEYLTVAATPRFASIYTSVVR